MSRSRLPSSPNLSLEQERLVDRLCDRFESAYRRGENPRIEKFLAGVSEPLQNALLRELVFIELHYLTTTLNSESEYLRRFPGLDRDWLCGTLQTTEKNETPSLARAAERSLTPGLSTDELERAAHPLGAGCRFGDYELHEELGRGGMGVIYKAQQVSLRRQVAIKFILRGVLASTEEVHRFRIEAEAAARLDHPNILPVYDFGEYQGQHYLTMKLIESGNLSVRCDEFEFCLRDDTAHPAPGSDTVARQRRVAWLVGTVARAVHHAHQRGILHRDLKPSNIMLDEVGEPYLTDFGLAKMTLQSDKVTATGGLIGTPRYMAPELASGQTDNVSTAVDTYALGVILYELLTGRPPIEGDTPLQILDRATKEEPAPPRKLQPDLSRDLETVCLKCLQKSPQARYATAADLADDLDRFRRGEPVLARSVSRAEYIWRWCRRNPAVAGLASALALVSLVGVALVLLSWGDALRANRRSNKALNDLQTQKKKTDEEADRARTAAQRATSANEKLRDELLRSATTRYAQTLGLAKQRILEGQLSSAESLLDTCPMDLVGWEYHYLKRLCRPRVQRLVGHTDRILATVFSVNGTYLASGGKDRVIRIWAVPTGKEWARLDGASSDVIRLAVCAHTERLACVCKDRKVYVWDLVSKKFLWKGEVPNTKVTSFCFSRDGTKLFASGREGWLCRWEAIRGVKLPPLSYPDCWDLAVSSDGVHLALSETMHGPFRCWDVLRGKEIKIPGLVGVKREKTLPPPAYSFQFAPDGKRLFQVVRLSVSPPQPLPSGGLGEACSEQLWAIDLTEKRVNFVMQTWSGLLVVSAIPGAPRPLIRTRDLTFANFGFVETSSSPVHAMSSGNVGVYCLKDIAFGFLDSASWSGFAKRIDHRPLTEVGISPDSRHVAAATQDNTIHLLSNSPHWCESTPTQGVHFSPDGARRAVRKSVLNGRKRVSSYNLLLQDVRTNNVVRILQENVHQSTRRAFSPDSELLATVGGPKNPILHIWDAKTGKPRHRLKGHKITVRKILFSPSSRLLASCDEEGIIRVWDTEEGVERQCLKGHRDAVGSLAFSPDGGLLLSGSADGTARLWDIESGDQLHSLNHADKVVSVAFRRDGQRVATASPGVVNLWLTATGELVQSFDDGISRLVGQISFTPDGRRIIFSSSAGSPKVLDVKTGELLLHIPRGSSAATPTFSQDGSTLRIGALTWRADTGPLPLWRVRGGKHIAFARNEGVVGVASYSGIIDRFEVTTGESVFNRPSQIFPHDIGLYLDVSPGDNWIAVGRKNVVKLLDSRTGRVSRELDCPATLYGLGFSQDGSKLAAYHSGRKKGRSVVIWKSVTGERVAEWPVDLAWTPARVKFSRDLRLGSFTRHNGEISLRQLPSGKEFFHICEPSRCKLHGCFGPRAEQFASAPDQLRPHQGLVRIWDLKSKKQKTSFFGMAPIAFHPSGRYLASCDLDNTIQLHDLLTGKKLSSFRGHTSTPQELVFSHDGSRLASCDRNNVIKLWDVSSWLPNRK